MVPRAAVVTRPAGGVTLRAGVSSAREHERPEVRTKLKHAVVGGAHVLHAENVVNLAMRCGAAAVHAVDCVERHGLLGGPKDGRLVHVVPEAANPQANEFAIERSPPLP